jgi:hypothetical protein
VRKSYALGPIIGSVLVAAHDARVSAGNVARLDLRLGLLHRLNDRQFALTVNLLLVVSGLSFFA